MFDVSVENINVVNSSDLIGNAAREIKVFFG